MGTLVAITLTFSNSPTFAHCKHVFAIVGHLTLLYTCFCWGNMVASTLGLALAIGCKCIRALSLCSGCRSPQLRCTGTPALPEDSLFSTWNQAAKMKTDGSSVALQQIFLLVYAVFRTKEQAHTEVLWAWILFWDGSDVNIHKEQVRQVVWSSGIHFEDWLLWKTGLRRVNA